MSHPLPPRLATGLAALVGLLLAAPCGADESDLAALERELTDHIKRIDAHAAQLAAPEFPAGKEWFNSPPLRFSKELAGKIVVLDFWTYCCINCIHILPDLAELEEKYASYPVAFVGVHSAKFDNEKVSENIRQAVLRYEIAHPVINDDEMLMWRAIGVRSWPSLAVVGPRGNLLLMVSGEGNKDVLDACISAALAFYPADAFRHDPVPVALERDRVRIDSPLRFPGKLAVDGKGGRLFISDSNHNRIVVTRLDGMHVTTIGRGRAGLVDGSFEEARFNLPQGLAFHEGSLYVADAENHAIRRVDLEAGRVETIAGTGRQGQDRSGGGIGREQEISTPWDVAVTPRVLDGALIIAMAGTHQIWTHQLETGVTAVLSGTGRELNLNHEDPRLAAWAQPSGLAIGPDEIYVADSESSSVRGIKIPGGATRTIVGGDDESPRNLFAFGDVDGVGDEARLQHALGVAWIPSLGRVAVADTYNHRLKLLDPEKARVEAWVGSGDAGLVDGTGLEARFAEPSGFALAPDGKTLLVADTNNHAIRVVDIATRKVSTLKLTDVPAALPRTEPRSQRLADLPGTTKLAAAPTRLEAGARATVRVELTLPEGHHYTEGATSRWQVLAGSDAGLELDESSGRLVEGKPITVQLTAGAKPARTTLRIEAVAYYCKQDGACLIGSVLAEVPIEITAKSGGAPEPVTIALEHAFAETVPDFGKKPGGN